MRSWLAIGFPALAWAACGSAVAESKAAGPRGDVAKFFGPDAYPPEAIRASQEGRVVARLGIDDKGKVVSCTLTVSSGSSALDGQTCRIALDRLTFTPATNREGRAIAATYPLAIRWIIPETPPVEVGRLPTDETSSVTVSVAETGEVLACNYTPMPTLMTQQPMQRPCDPFPVGTISRYHWLRDGKPVGGTVTWTIRQRVSIDP